MESMESQEAGFPPFQTFLGEHERPNPGPLDLKGGVMEVLG